MPLITQIDLLAYSLLISLILIAYLFRNYSFSEVSTRLFFSIMLFTSLVIILEMLTWVVDGVDTRTAFLANYILNFLDDALEYIPGFFWLLYIDNKINDDYDSMKRKIPYFLIPQALLIIILLISFRTGCVFTILPGNIYARGPGIYWFTSIHYVQYLIALYMVIRYRRNVNSELFSSLMAYFFLPIAATVIQLFLYGTTIIWPVFVLIDIIAFTLLEKDSLLRDPLTGIYTRGVFEHQVFQMVKKEKDFTLMMIDMDKFKYINDTFGHQTGDQALIELVEIVKRVKRKSDMLCRYGGDEFMIMIRGGNRDSGKLLKERIQKGLDEQNLSGNRPYDLLMSVGIYPVEGKMKTPLPRILEMVDKAMYREKTRHRETYSR